MSIGKVGPWPGNRVTFFFFLLGGGGGWDQVMEII